MTHRHHGKCVGCQTVRPLERHHIRPRRFYGNNTGNQHIVLLCTTCHRELETKIPLERQMPDYWYFLIVAVFIKERSRCEVS